MTASYTSLKIGLIGYGEVGKILAQALRRHGLAWVGAWDILFRDAAEGPPMQAHAREAGIEACASAGALLERADVVISAVTAANALEVAKEAAGSIRAGTYFLDLNSASPGTKARSAKLIEAAGGHYVEAGVMTSLPPHGIRVPMVVGGKRAGELAARLAPLGFRMEVVAAEIGVASAIKMCRSIIVKGMEAMVIESYMTARRYGVEKRVLESLQETFPGLDWEKQGAYFFHRVAKHGRRRAEEMREAAVTVREAGFEPWIAAATAEKQDWMAALARSGLFRDVKEGEWRDYADELLAAPTSAKANPPEPPCRNSRG
jgi:3-hydroxyisobutyrate dehydrogenase-like beta-hydroxyacid dehydrogenase